MGLDVSVHVITKDFKLINKNLLKFLPYDFRFSFYPDCGHSVYNNIFYFHEIVDETVKKKILGLYLDHPMLWAAFVKVQDVKQYMYESEEDLSSCYDQINELDDDTVLVVTGDQYYKNRTINNVLDKSYGYIDPWYIRKGSLSYSQHTVYMIRVQGDDHELFFYNEDACKQFVSGLEEAGIKLPWEEPVRIATAAITPSEEEMLDIPVDEAVDNAVDWCMKLMLKMESERA